MRQAPNQLEPAYTLHIQTEYLYQNRTTTPYRPLPPPPVSVSFALQIDAAVVCVTTVCMHTVMTRERQRRRRWLRAAAGAARADAIAQNMCRFFHTGCLLLHAV